MALRIVYGWHPPESVKSGFQLYAAAVALLALRTIHSVACTRVSKHVPNPIILHGGMFAMMWGPENEVISTGSIALLVDITAANPLWNKAVILTVPPMVHNHSPRPGH